MSSDLERPPVVLVSRCVIQNEVENLLLVRRTEAANHNAGLWEFPGGKVDIGQVVDYAQEREVLEETGLRIEPTHPPILVGSRMIEDGPYAGMLYTILCGVGRVTGGELVLSNEHTDASWVPYERLFHKRLTKETRRAARLLGSVGFLGTSKG